MGSPLLCKEKKAVYVVDADHSKSFFCLFRDDAQDGLLPQQITSYCGKKSESCTEFCLSRASKLPELNNRR